MIYEKPKISYADMAIWIDENAYKNELDVDKLFMYLYHLSLMLAGKRKYYYDNDQRESFAVYCATQMFNRYQTGDKINSVMNYLSKKLYYMRVDFSKSEFSCISTEEYDLFGYNKILHDGQINTDDFLETDLKQYIQSIPSMLKKYVDKYCKFNSIKNDIYINCLITLRNIGRGKSSIKVTTINIPDIYKNYVYVFTKGFMSLILKDIRELMEQHNISDIDMYRLPQDDLVDYYDS